MKNYDAINKKWFVIKLFKRYLNGHISLVDRSFLINPVYLFTKMRDMFHSDVRSFKDFTKEQFDFVSMLVDNDRALSQNVKKDVNEMLVQFQQNNLQNAIKKLKDICEKIDLKGSESYYKKVESNIKFQLNEFLYKNRNDFEQLRKSIASYISTRLDLGFSRSILLKMMKTAEDKATNNDDSFMELIFDKFASKNVFNKEMYDVFIPLKIQPELNPKIYISYFEKNSLGVKFGHYSYVEKKIEKLNHYITKDFNKDCLYMCFESVEALDYNSVAHKYVFEKASVISSIFKINSQVIEVDLNSPIITAKRIKGETKVNGVIVRRSEYNEIETLHPFDAAATLLKQISQGEYEESTKKIKNYLIAKSEFEHSTNLTQKCYLANRLAEIFLKIPYKKSYGGGNNSKFNEYYNVVSNKIANYIIKLHMQHIILNNYSTLSDRMKFLKIQQDNVIESYKVEDSKTELVQEIFSKLNKQDAFSKLFDWEKYIISEYDRMSRQSDEFISYIKGYIEVVFILVHSARNSDVHSSSSYNFKEVVLAETLDAFISVAMQQKSFMLFSKAKKLYNENA